MLRRSAVLLTIALAACDSEIVVNGGGGSGGHDGGNGGAGGATDACDAFNDEPSAGQVSIVLRNESGIPIYLQGMCSKVALDLFPSSDPESPYSYWFEHGCLQTCEELRTESPILCDACEPLVYRLDPGATIDATWDGTKLENSVAMPESCWASPEFAGNTCSRVRSAEAANYQINLLGYADCPGCTCDADGTCHGFASGQEAYPDPTNFSFPGDTTVEVVFGVCAFPCPGG
ncbi:MAG: hypothetical protein U0271_21530 [Polyangiaceae bacterium]